MKISLSIACIKELTPYLKNITDPSNRVWMELANETDKGRQFGEIEFPVDDSYKLNSDYPLSFSFYNESGLPITDLDQLPYWFGKCYALLSDELDELRFRALEKESSLA